MYNSDVVETRIIISSHSEPITVGSACVASAQRSVKIAWPSQMGRGEGVGGGGGEVKIE